jgi:hypothetical protein
MITPAVIAHADWGIAPRKRQLAVATLHPAGVGYEVVSVAPAPTGQPPPGDLFQYLSAMAGRGQAMIGFDFPVGLPVAYAKAAGISSFPEFLDAFASPPPPWREFATVAGHRDEITLRRPFYPDRPGGTERQHLYDALGLPAGQLRRRCEGTDAEILFWTLGGKQVGKGALAGWRLLAAARHREPGIALWPFDGPLPGLLDAGGRTVVAETYPREFYQYIRPPAHPRARWSKRRQADRRSWACSLLRWAESLAVSWHPGVLSRVEAGFSAGPNGEDEFDAVAGLLGMIAVVTGTIPPGEPPDAEITTIEGWILGRRG